MERRVVGQKNSIERVISSMLKEGMISSSIILEGSNYIEALEQILDIIDGEVIARIDSNSIKIDIVRKSLLLCHKSNNRQKIFIVTNAHAMKPEIYNLMLKSVEEPINTLFIFCTKNFVAGTIRSRSIPITLENRVINSIEDSRSLEEILEGEIDQESLKGFIKKVFDKKFSKKDILEMLERVPKTFFKDRSRVILICNLFIEVSLEDRPSITEKILKIKRGIIEGVSPEYSIFTLFQITQQN